MVKYHRNFVFLCLIKSVTVELTETHSLFFLRCLSIISSLYTRFMNNCSTVVSEMYKLTPWNSVLQKPVVAQMVKFLFFYFLNTKINFRVQKNPPFYPVLSQLNPLYTLKPCLFNFNIIQSTPKPLKWSLPSGFPAKMLYAFLISLMHATCLTHRVLLESLR